MDWAGWFALGVVTGWAISFGIITWIVCRDRGKKSGDP